VYKLLKEYRNRRILSILFAKLLLGKKVKLIVDGTILEVANLNRARTQRIKRFSGKAFWGKKKRNLYSEHYKEKVRFEEMYYGVLVMVKMSTFGVHRLDWLVVSKRFPWNAKYETVYRWLASFIVIYTIMNLKS
jgi:hypothetical protein